MSGAEQPFSGLPEDMLSELLGDSAAVSARLDMTIRELAGKREELRKQLADAGVLASLGDNGGLLIDCSAIDAVHDAGPLFFDQLIAGAAFRAVGLPAEGTDDAVGETAQRHVFAAGGSCTDSGNIAAALSAEMKIELIAGAPRGLLLYRGSLARDFYSVLSTLPQAMRMKDTKIGGEFLSHLKPALAALKQASENMSATVPVFFDSDCGREEIIGGLSGLSGLCQDAVMTVLTDPGDYTMPKAFDEPEIERAVAVPIKDPAFAGLRDSAVAWFGGFRLLYYRPQQWTPAFRIAMPSAVADDDGKRAAVLRSISGQCATAGLAQPYPLYIARELTRYFMNALPTLKRTSIDNISSSLDSDLATILPLLRESALKTR